MSQQDTKRTTSKAALQSMLEKQTAAKINMETIPQDTEADAMVCAAIELLHELETMVQSRLDKCSCTADVTTEARAQLMVWRALGLHHGEKVRKLPIQPKARKRIERAVELTRKMIPRPLQ